MKNEDITYYPEAMINGKIHKDVFKCHKDTKIAISNMDMMISRELQENDIVAFTVCFGWHGSPLYKLMKTSKINIINTEK
jgi:hypothetical protein